MTDQPPPAPSPMLSEQEILKYHRASSFVEPEDAGAAFRLVCDSHEQLRAQVAALTQERDALDAAYDRLLKSHDRLEDDALPSEPSREARVLQAFKAELRRQTIWSAGSTPEHRASAKLIEAALERIEQETV